MITATVEAHRADDDLERVTLAGLGASQASLARVRAGVVRSWRTGHRFSAQAELLNNLAPVMARTMAVAHLLGERRVVLSAPRALALDRFSEVTRQLKVAGLDRGLNRLQRGYARRVYESLRQLGAEVDATTRAVVGSLVAEGEPPGRALQVLRATLDRLGVGPEAQSRAETLYRTEAAIAYQTGRWAKVQERWDDVWGFAYVTMRDDRVRPSHAALEGTRLEKDHPFWQRWWPPNGWNCRCQVAVIWRTPGYRHRPVKPGKLNGVVPRPDRGFERNFGLEYAALARV